MVCGVGEKPPDPRHNDDCNAGADGDASAAGWSHVRSVQQPTQIFGADHLSAPNADAKPEAAGVNTWPEKTVS